MKNPMLVLRKVPGMITMASYACKSLLIDDFGAMAGPALSGNNP
jgi:hypothetical protein